MNRFIYIAIGLMILIALSLSGSAQRSKINRIHPQQGTEQYRKEAVRVRLQYIAEKVGLSEDQMIKMKGADDRRMAKLKKEEEKVKKAEAKLAKEKASIAASEDKIRLEYVEKVKSILTPDQYEAYLILMRQYETSQPSETDECNPDGATEGSIGPIVKSEQQLMYEGENK